MTASIQVWRVLLLLLVVVSSFQLLAQSQGKERTVDIWPSIEPSKLMDFPSFTEKPARRTRRQFSSCTGCPHPRECSNHSLAGSLIDIASSRPITPGSDTATGRTLRSLPIALIIWPRL